jgi:hypothetical protein
MTNVDLSALTGPVLVTVGYVLFWYYLLFIVQRGTKYRLQARYAKEGKTFDRYFGQDEEMLAADRAVGNTHEQMGPFLLSLWLCAIFGSAIVATWAGAGYIGLRIVYPTLLGSRLSKIQSKRVYLVTLPSYTLVLGMLGVTVWGVLTV